ncbi:hypothetical protein Q3C01_01130 [Bradyrhizobium sp. UFLA05-109]
MTEQGLGRPFDQSIEVPGGELVTLRDVGHYIAKLPKAVHDRPEWQAAAEALLLEHGGPTILAAIGIRRALNAGKPDHQTAARLPHR